MSENTEDEPVEGGIMAALAVIGGVDSRPRLGGMVHHNDHGVGTVSRIAANGKITMQCQGSNEVHTCSISHLNSVRTLKSWLLFGGLNFTMEILKSSF